MGFFPYGDKTAQTNIVAQGDGDGNNWHYDECLDMTATLMLQMGEEGGHFELVENLKDPGGADKDKLRAILSNESNECVVRVPQHPGTLIIFNRRTTLHRITPMKGERKRLVLALSYGNQPDMQFTAASRASSYDETTSGHG